MSSSMAENGFSCLPGDCATGAAGGWLTGNEFNLRSSWRFLSSSANCFKDSRTILAFSGRDSLPLMSGSDNSWLLFRGAFGTFTSLGTIVVVDAGALRIVFVTSARERRRFLGESGPAWVNETTFLAGGAFRGVFGALASSVASSWPKSSFCLMRFEDRVLGAE